MATDFEFGGAVFEAAGEAALYWPRYRALLVADLHLEKASSFAKTSGQMLPPYDSHATLLRLSQLAAKYEAEQIYCLGDNFHDDDGETRLPEQAATILTELTQRLRWHWIVGNHDPGMVARWGGNVFTEIEKDGIMLRHNVDPAESGAEISGHYHPKIHVKARRRMVSRRCFLQSANRLIMPAFGALTGGMDVRDILRAEKLIGVARAIVPLKSGLAEFAIEEKAATAA